MYFENFEIKPREIIFSFIIIAVMLTFGFVISGKIKDAETDKTQEYNTALKIADGNTEMFKYGMSTNVGNTFIYGTITTVDPVTYSDVADNYIYIRKEKEKYTAHTRPVSDGKKTTIETYYTWDNVRTDSKYATKFKFCGGEFEVGKIKFSNADYIDTVYETTHVRYIYYGHPAIMTGTMYSYLKNNTISDETIFYKNKNVEETVKHLETYMGNIIFWIVWILLTAGFVFLFYYVENNWLE